MEKEHDREEHQLMLASEVANLENSYGEMVCWLLTQVGDPTAVPLSRTHADCVPERRQPTLLQPHACALAECCARCTHRLRMDRAELLRRGRE